MTCSSSSLLWTHNLREAAFRERSIVRTGMEAIINRRCVLIESKIGGKTQVAMTINSSRAHDYRKPTPLPKWSGELHEVLAPSNIVLSADLEFLSCFFGHQGAAASFPCIFCLVHKNSLTNVFLSSVQPTMSITDDALGDVALDSVAKAPMHTILGFTKTIVGWNKKCLRRLETIVDQHDHHKTAR